MPRRKKSEKKAATGKSVARKGRMVRLKPANPFDLIRLIALSQSDPRKAVAELVQNSLDAGARSITVTRQRRRGQAALSILDDGQGIFPALGREEALERIATNIGSSFKQNLSPAERQTQMTLGKYGIGLLGFWAVGEEMEIRTRVAGSEVWGLRLLRDLPEAGVFRMPQQRFPFEGETWTEILIRSVDESASRQLVGRRLGEYLGSELRGQILDRKVRLRIVDRMARGTALKDFRVVPHRFRGREVLRVQSLPVPGFPPARAELFLIDAGEERRGAVRLTCGGALVVPDLAGLEGDLDLPPWSLGVLEGEVEFPALEVAPATRRGFVAGPASEAILAAIRTLEPDLLAAIDAERLRRAEEEDEDVAQEIRKVFRPLPKALPQYDFFEIAADGRRTGRAAGEEGKPLGGPEAAPGGETESVEAPASEVVEEGDVPPREAEILPPGPMARVIIVPRRTRMLPGASRQVRARALDASGRVIAGGIVYLWRIAEGGGALVPEGDAAVFTAPEITGPVRIAVEAREADRSAAAEAHLEVVERLAGERPDAGIPDPVKVFDPDGDWRSRVEGRRWEYNASHPDYRCVEADARRRLRYLVHLFAKEMVLRNFGEPKDERLLERFVEVLTHIRPRG